MPGIMCGVEVRIAGALDALGISQCFLGAYGSSYPNAWATDPRALAARIERQVSIFAVAEQEGAVVGATALEPRSDGTGDLCHAAVLHSHRRLGLFTTMNEPLLERARALGLRALFGRCVTTHPYSQRAMASIGSVLAGLSLSVAPKSMSFLGIREALPQREACFDSVLMLERPASRVRVNVPRELRRVVSHVYSVLGVECEFNRRPVDPPRFRLSCETDPELAISTLRFGSRGPRPARALDEELGRLEAQGSEALFAELPLGSPGTPSVIEALRERGFSFAAVLPRRAEGGGDAIRLQRPLHEVFPSVVVAADLPGVEVLRSLVFEDRAVVAGAAAL
jgi:hypothetical protein